MELLSCAFMENESNEMCVFLFFVLSLFRFDSHCVARAAHFLTWRWARKSPTIGLIESTIKTTDKSLRRNDLMYKGKRDKMTSRNIQLIWFCVLCAANASQKWKSNDRKQHHHKLCAVCQRTASRHCQVSLSFLAVLLTCRMNILSTWQTAKKLVSRSVDLSAYTRRSCRTHRTQRQRWTGEIDGHFVAIAIATVCWMPNNESSRSIGHFPTIHSLRRTTPTVDRKQVAACDSVDLFFCRFVRRSACRLCSISMLPSRRQVSVFGNAKFSSIHARTCFLPLRKTAKWSVRWKSTDEINDRPKRSKQNDRKHKIKFKKNIETKTGWWRRCAQNKWLYSTNLDRKKSWIVCVSMF